MRKKRVLKFLAFVVSLFLIGVPVVQLLLKQFQPEGELALSSQSNQYQFFSQQLKDEQNKYVHFMHLDGFHSEIFKTLLDNGQLPHFQLLQHRAKWSVHGSTVDKSETMKVIQSYMTSRRDTEITAWWQFSRNDFQFRNFWLNPVEVLNYALGLDFPRYPTFYDYLSTHDQNSKYQKLGTKNLAAGFTLHRRGVPFENYGRAYVEGAYAVFNHTYFEQAHATMDSLITILNRIFKNNEKIPILTSSLLAPADEYCHLEGVTLPESYPFNGEYCLVRDAKNEDDKKRNQKFIETIESDLKNEKIWEDLYRKKTKFPLLSKLKSKKKRTLAFGPFTAVDIDDVSRTVNEICFNVPKIKIYVNPVEISQSAPKSSIGDLSDVYVQPRYVLGMIAVDLELGRLINALRQVRQIQDNKFEYNPSFGNGIVQYIKKQRLENSLFEKTLFVMTGDHGMVDTKFMMAPVNERHPDPFRDERSQSQSFIEYLNEKLGYKTYSNKEIVSSADLIGIDDSKQPLEIAYPHLNPSWQDSQTQKLVQVEAQEWSNTFFSEIKTAVKTGAYKKYWWIYLLHKYLIDPKIDNAIDPYREQAVGVIKGLYLAGNRDYKKKEQEAVAGFYDKHVRLVYGGGARNNAELFLPASTNGKMSWSRRPTFKEITDYKGVNGVNLLNVLLGNPGVGVVFIRKNNEQFKLYKSLPNTMEVLVYDRFQNQGVITVKKDTVANTLLYHYKRLTEVDPLNVGALSREQGTWGTYNQWNDWGVVQNHYYHNAVAGIGSYLYSNNPAIGDILLMHAQGWNFGENAGGHGGIHRDEKKTLMFVSGPGVVAGDLMSKSPPEYLNGQWVQSNKQTHPTVVDIAPTILKWLGHKEKALTEFSRTHFTNYLDGWIRTQRHNVLKNLVNLENIENSLEEFGLPPVEFEDFKARLKRLLEFMPDQLPPLPNFNEIEEDGNQLAL